MCCLILSAFTDHNTAGHRVCHVAVHVRRSLCHNLFHPSTWEEWLNYYTGVSASGACTNSIHDFTWTLCIHFSRRRWFEIIAFVISAHLIQHISLASSLLRLHDARLICTKKVNDIKLHTAHCRKTGPCKLMPRQVHCFAWSRSISNTKKKQHEWMNVC